MSEANSVQSKPLCNIGTIGPRGVGKTALTSAITKILAESGGATFTTCDAIDHTDEERHRGIGVFTTRVEYETERRRYVHFDTPAPVVRNRFDLAGEIQACRRTANMMAGALEMDGAILVVSAHPIGFESTEWVPVAREAGIPAIVVFMNRMDQLASPDDDDLEYEDGEIRHLLSHQGFPVDGLPIIHGSALAALEGRDPQIGRDAILELLSAVDSFIPQPEEIGIHWAEDNKPTPT